MLFVFTACVQESFSASGGLETLTLELVRLASAADTSILSCQLSVIISKTISACITDNCAYCTQAHIYITILRVHFKNHIYNLFFVVVLASGLAQYAVVSHLFSLLASPHLDPEDRLSVLLTVGHCTEASGETTR